MGSLMAQIKRTGTIRLSDDGRLICKQDNGQIIGEIVVGIDGVYFDGFEPIFCQRNDPSKLRLASRYDDGQDGLNGVISYNRLREDDRMEERVQLQGGPAEDWPGHQFRDRGQFKVMILKTAGEDWVNAFVATTAYLNRLWTGAANSLGWLYKFANSGEAPPAGSSTPTPGPAPAPSQPQPQEPGVLYPDQQIHSPNSLIAFALQGDGNVVLYASGAPVWSSGTVGVNARELVMQGDGNLVLYAQDSSAPWSSGTQGHEGATLEVTNNKVRIVHNGVVVWSKPDGGG